VLINESDLAKAVIKSPIDGIVLTRSIEPGQTVAASFTAPELFIIAENLEHMKLDVAVAEADIGRVAKDQKASFTVDAWPSRSYQASVLKVSYGSAVTDNVVTYETELEVANTDLSLRPGMTATADIHVAESKNVFLVPSAALRFDPSAVTPTATASAKKTFVQSLSPMPPRRTNGSGKTDGAVKSSAGHARIWVLRNGKPEAISVAIGLADERHTEVSGEGLTEGMQIIIRANAVTP
jgi:HlyD family secretion protein